MVRKRKTSSDEKSSSNLAVNLCSLNFRPTPPPTPPPTYLPPVAKKLETERPTTTTPKPTTTYEIVKFTGWK